MAPLERTPSTPPPFRAELYRQEVLSDASFRNPTDDKFLDPPLTLVTEFACAFMLVNTV